MTNTHTFYENNENYFRDIHKIFPEAPKLITFDATDTLVELREEVGFYYMEAWKNITYESRVQYKQTTQNVSVDLPPQKKFTDAFYNSFKETNAKYPSFGLEHNIKPKEWWRKVVHNTYILVYSSLDPKIHKNEIEWFAWELGKNSALLNEIFELLYSNLFTSDQVWKVRSGVLDVLQSFAKRKKNLQSVVASNKKHSNTLYLAVLSNNDDRLPVILENVGILDYFDHVFTSCELKVSKPDPEIFIRTLSHVKAEIEHLLPIQCMHIGDSFSKDVIGASSCGWHAIHVPRDRGITSKNNEKPLNYSTVDDLYGVLKIYDSYEKF